MRTKSKRTIRPSGVEQTDSMFYWKCSVSGLVMFATPERFADVVKNFGSEENLVKTYVLRPVKKYVDAGYTSEQIKAIIAKHDGKLPPLECNNTEVKTANVVRPEKKHSDSIVVDAIEIKPIEQPKEKPPVVYDWQGSPDYFKGIAAPNNLREDTKEICFYPGRNIEDQCRGCLIYSDCTCSAKFSPEDQLKPRRNEVKVKVIAVFD